MTVSEKKKETFKSITRELIEKATFPGQPDMTNQEVFELGMHCMMIHDAFRKVLKAHYGPLAGLVFETLVAEENEKIFNELLRINPKFKELTGKIEALYKEGKTSSEIYEIMGDELKAACGENGCPEHKKGEEQNNG